MRRGSWCLIVVLLVAGFACAHGRGAATDTAAAEPADGVVRLEATNESTLPLEIYVVGSGIRHRLGTVSPGIAGHFVVPKAMIGNGLVEFLAGAARSGQLLLSPGDVVDFVIRVPAFNSTATVRR